MFPIREDLVWATGRFTSANPPVIEQRDGWGAILRNGAGDYTITLDRGINLITATGLCEGLVVACAQHTAFANITWVPLTPTTIQLLNFDAAAAAQEVGRIVFVVLRCTPLT